MQKKLKEAKEAHTAFTATNDNLLTLVHMDYAEYMDTPFMHSD